MVMKMKRNKIAKYASMVSAELHTEYLAQHDWYVRDIMSEVIDKIDNIEAMARIRWYNKWYYQLQTKRYLNGNSSKSN